MTNCTKIKRIKFPTFHVLKQICVVKFYFPAKKAISTVISDQKIFLSNRKDESKPEIFSHRKVSVECDSWTNFADYEQICIILSHYYTAQFFFSKLVHTQKQDLFARLEISNGFLWELLILLWTIPYKKCTGVGIQRLPAGSSVGNL